MMPVLNIVTPCIRPENLPAIGLNIGANNKDYHFDVKWHIVFDGPMNTAILTQGLHEFNIIPILYSLPHDSRGCAQRNIALDSINYGWVYFLDDDNLFPDGFFAYASELIKGGHEAYMFNVTVKFKDDVEQYLAANAENVEPDCCDTAQFLLKRSLIGESRWPEKYNGDGLFYQEVYSKNPQAFRFTDYTVRYNALR